METLCSQRKKKSSLEKWGVLLFLLVLLGQVMPNGAQRTGKWHSQDSASRVRLTAKDSFTLFFLRDTGKIPEHPFLGLERGKKPWRVARIMVRGNWAFQGLRSSKSSGTELDVLSAVPTETLVLPGVAGEVEKGDSRWWLSTDITSCSAELVPAALTLLSSAWGHLTELSWFVAHNTQPRASIQSLLRASATTWKGQMRKPSLLW